MTRHHGHTTAVMVRRIGHLYYVYVHALQVRVMATEVSLASLGYYGDPDKLGPVSARRRRRGVWPREREQ